VKKDTSTNSAWKQIFERLNFSTELEKHGIVHITAKSIAKISGREPRLMAKFDQRKHRPDILSSHGVTILPTANGRYALLQGDGYIGIPEPRPESIQRYDASHLEHIKSIPWRRGVHSEPQAIDTLFIASAIRKFVGDETLISTIRGKLRSDSFSFRFTTSAGEKRIDVDGAQLEIDSGYEGNVLVLIEAKLGSVQDTITRQLYFPFLHFQKLAVGKRIVCLFLVYSNKVYSLYEFSFGRSGLYQDAKISRQQHLALEDTSTLPRFKDVISSRTVVAPKGIPFPQADDISKIIDVVEILSSGPEDKAGIAEKFDVDPRQGDYYGNGAAWLGLAEKSDGGFTATPKGEEFSSLDRSQRLARLAEMVSAMPVFHDAAFEQVQSGQIDTQLAARSLVRNFGLSQSTGDRRALTVRAWIQWLAKELRQ
jgi:hypothetical protein